MRVSLPGGRQWRFWFRYPPPTVVLSYDRTFVRITACSIASEAEPGLVLATGYARLHPNDRFCRESGRKIALARALAGMGFGKQERRAFWESYINRRALSARGGAT